MNISSLLQVYNSTNNDIPICTICQESLRKKYFFLIDYFINHLGGIKHPFHRGCLIENLNYSKNCPSCRESIEEKTLPYSKIERALFPVESLLNFLKKNIYFCAVIATSVFSMYIFCTQRPNFNHDWASFARCSPNLLEASLIFSLCTLSVETMNKLTMRLFDHPRYNELRVIGFLFQIYAVVSIWYQYHPPMDKFILIGSSYTKD